MSFNRAVVLGRVGKDPVIKHTTDGNQIASFSLATSSFSNRNGEKKEYTEWHNLVCYGRTAELVANYVKKGTQLLAEGSLKTSKYEKDGVERYTTQIVVSSIQLLGGNTVPSEKKEMFVPGPKEYGDSDVPF